MGARMLDQGSQFFLITALGLENLREVSGLAGTGRGELSKRGEWKTLTWQVPNGATGLKSPNACKQRLPISKHTGNRRAKRFCSWIECFFSFSLGL